MYRSYENPHKQNGGICMFKFEKGAFYKFTSESLGGKITEYAYCIDILNENEGTEYKPFWVVKFVSISSEVLPDIESDENGLAKNNYGYGKITESEFATVLLKATVEGNNYLSEGVRHYRQWKIERKEARATANLPDFGFGNDNN